MYATISDISKGFSSGGAAACVTAGRLAAADPSLKILVRIADSMQGILNVPGSRYWKLVDELKIWQIIYSLLDTSEIWCYPQKPSPSMSANPVRL